MTKATEVELELLGLQESVEMLAAVAEIDGAVSPACLEIVQLCGREYMLCYYIRQSFGTHIYAVNKVCLCAST